LYLPHRFVPNSVVYTGTHDNNTTQGWWRDDAGEGEREHVQSYLGPIRYDGDINWAMMRAAARSVANTCIFPMQDVLHIGSEGRMNTPSAPVGNWSWRYPSNALHPDFSTQLAALMEMTDRDGYIAPEEDPEEAGKPTDLAAKRVQEGSLA